MTKFKIMPIAIVLLMYVIFSFLTVNLNPLEWIWLVRFIYVVATGVSLWIWFENVESINDEP